ncbi:MAG: peptidylprolyl isomerase [Anaerolineae bacterium]
MTDAPLTVKDGLVVSLDYTLQLDDGQEIDTSAGQGPLEFLQGHGQIVPGLEQALYGMAVDEEKGVVVIPADGYGETDPDNYELVPREAFPADLELTEGMGLRMRDANSGQILEAYVTEIRPDGVLLNFNHPLAGETLHFHVKIVALRPATSEELTHGHVHGPGHDH